MAGIGGKHGWAWIFILEGLATVVLGVISYWMVHDFPAEAKFLGPDDRARVLRRLHADKQSSAHHEEFKMAYVWAAVKDWKTWAFALIYMGADMPLYAFSLFTPSIIQQLSPGTSATRANLLSVPPYAAAAVVTIAMGFLADKTQKRGFFNMGMPLVGAAGFAMLLGSTNPNVKYAGVFLGAMGIYPCIPNTISWAANNVEGVYKRGVVLGFVIGWGNLTGVISSNIYLASEAKTGYKTGHSIVLAFLCVFLCGGSTITHFLLAAENKKRLAGQRDHRVEGKTAAEIELLGDQRPDFLYTT